VALGSTVVKFEVDVSHVDQGRYEQLSLDVAQHPSESAPWLVARVLAYALEHREGIAFSQGLAAGEEPAVWVHDLTGQLTEWIEVGTPDAARLHKASKAADRVVVYSHRGAGPWLESLAGERVHRADHIEIVVLDPAFVEALAQGLQRRNGWTVSVIDDTLYVEAGEASHSVELARVPFPGKR
jgi:uncharacterized protein YaeQ